MKTILEHRSLKKIVLSALLFALVILYPICFYSHAQDMLKADIEPKKSTELKTELDLKTDIRLKINEKDMNADYEVMLLNDRLMVPMRLVAEKLGADIKWNNEERSVIMENQGKKITLYIDKLDVEIDGKKSKLDVKPFLHKDRTMVPIRFLAENLSCSVKWDNATRTAFIDQNFSEKDKVDFEVISDLSKYDFLSEYANNNSKYAFGKSFEKDGYSYAIISYGEQNSGGYSVKIDGVYLLEQEYHGEKVFVVKSYLETPAPDAIVTMALTYPKAIIRFENKAGLKVRIPFDSNANLGELK